MQYPKLKIFINLFHALTLSEKAFFTMISRLIFGKKCSKAVKRGTRSTCKTFPQIDCSEKFCKISGKTSNRVTLLLKRDSYTSLQESLLDFSEQHFPRTTWKTASGLVTISYIILYEEKIFLNCCYFARRNYCCSWDKFLAKQKEPSNKWSFIQKKNMTRLLAWWQLSSRDGWIVN